MFGNVKSKVLTEKKCIEKIRKGMLVFKYVYIFGCGNF